MKIAYEYRVHTDKTKCELLDNTNNIAYVVDLPYPFGHPFWDLAHDCPVVLEKSRKLIEQSLGE